MDCTLTSRVPTSGQEKAAVGSAQGAGLTQYIGAVRKSLACPDAQSLHRSFQVSNQQLVAAERAYFTGKKLQQLVQIQITCGRGGWSE